MLQKLNATQIKYAMASLMVLDHLPHIPDLISPFWAAIFHAVTRCVGVWFAYTAVEGFQHTRSLQRYLIRLYAWALLMGVGNFLLSWLFETRNISVSNNIFLTLAVGVTMLALAFPKAQWDKSWRILGWMGSLLLLIGGALSLEGGVVMLPFMMLTYAFRGNVRLRNGLYLLLSLILLILSFNDYGDWVTTLQMMLYNSDWLFITVLPILALYNGERGPKTKWNQYFFYIFYPAHLWLITVIAYLVSK